MVIIVIFEFILDHCFGAIFAVFGIGIKSFHKKVLAAKKRRFRI